MKKDIKVNQFVPWIILLCCLILIIGFFVPSFHFSCSGYGSVNVSALNAAFGVSYYGETASPALVYPILLLLLPIGVAVICFIKSIAEKIKAIIVAAANFTELVLYIILQCVAASFANEMQLYGYGIVKESVTVMWVFNILFSVIGILAGLFMIFENQIMGKIAMGGAKTPSAAPPLQETVHTAQPAPIPVNPAPVETQNIAQVKCANCGSLQRAGNAFCANCGSPLPTKPVCPSCGQELIRPDASFCTNCGAKLK